MKKILATLLLTVILISCGNQKIEIQQGEINKSNEHFEIVAKYPIIKGEVSNNVAKMFSELESSLQQYSQWIETSTTEITPTAPYNMYTDYQVFENKNLGVTSILVDASFYTGGAHSEVTKTVINIDNKTKEEYRLDKVLSEAKQKELLDKINNAIDNKQNFDGTPLDTFGNHVNSFSDLNFYFKDNKVIAFFNPYEIAPYSEGFIEFIFNADDLK